MRILSLDQSTQKTGWAVFEDGKLEDYGLLDFHTMKDKDERVITMGAAIMVLIENQRPDLIAVENVNLQNPNVHTMLELARLQGMILLAAHLVNQDLKVVFYYPVSWRKKVGMTTGKGIKRADLKKAAIQKVFETYHADVTDDVADAILIGQAAVADATEQKEK